MHYHDDPGPLPERTLQPPEPPPVCGDCNAYLDDDGDCAVCADNGHCADCRAAFSDPDEGHTVRDGDRLCASCHAEHLAEKADRACDAARDEGVTA